MRQGVASGTGGEMRGPEVVGFRPQESGMTSEENQALNDRAPGGSYSRKIEPGMPQGIQIPSSREIKS